MYIYTIFNELLSVYEVYSNNVSEIYSQRTENANMSILRILKTLWRDILKLISTFISKSTDPEVIIQEFL